MKKDLLTLLDFSAEDNYSGIAKLQYSYDKIEWLDGNKVTISGNTDL